MTPITFSLFGTRGPARSRRIDAGNRVNVYAEKSVDVIDGQTYLVWYSRPGLELWLDVGAAPVRGWRAFGGFLYAVLGANFYKIASDKGLEWLGALASVSGYVSIADDGLELVIADGSNIGYRYHPGTGVFGAIPAYPGGNTVAGLGGFVATDGYKDTYIYASDFRDVGVWSGYSAATESDLTPNKYVFSVADVLYVFSASTIELWYLAGGAFPFSPIQMAAIPYGLLSPGSVTPYQTGLTALVGGNGEIHLFLLSGSQFITLSDQAVEREWSTYSTVADATVAAFTSDAHPFLAISFPLAGVSWLFDGLSQSWAKLDCGLAGDRWIGQYSVAFTGRTLISDYSTGLIYAVELEAGADDALLPVWELESQPVYLGGAKFIVSDLELRLETGGAVIPTEPEITIQLADCGTWKPSRTISLGKTGERWRRGLLRQCGQFRELTVKLRCYGAPRLVLERAVLKVSA